MTKDTIDLRQVANKQLEHKLRNGVLVRNIQGPSISEVYLYNHSNHTRTKYNLNILKDALPSLIKDVGVSNLPFVYNPSKDGGPLMLGDDIIFNIYQCPSWRLQVKKENIQVTELPEIYKYFFEHLTEIDNVEDREYILDWLATSLHPDRHQPILSLIGKKGVGKGLLGEILSKLNGQENTCVTGQRILGGTFNQQLENKTFVHLDEIKVKDENQMNVLKLLINSRIEIEGKNSNARNIDFISNVYITSNNYDVFEISKDERRFSIPFITATDIKYDPVIIDKFGSDDVFYKACLQDDNIQQLGAYLLFRADNLITRNISHPFSSQRKIDVIVASLKEWESTVIDYVAMNGESVDSVGTIGIAYSALKRMLVQKEYFKNEAKAPGREKMEKLVNKLPHADCKWIWDDYGKKERYFTLANKDRKEESI